MAVVLKFCSRLFRKKIIDEDHLTETQLARCLSTFDLTALGIGSTLGAGIYVVAGQVARSTAGPAVTLSFFIAAVASIFAGLCYAEFGARVPKTGSAYVYSYVTVGELWAFIIGWNLILEYTIGTASVARGWSSYFDSLINKAISNYFVHHTPMHVPHLASYPDFFALGITLVLTVILAVGVKESSMFNNIFTGINMLVVLYVIICGLFKASFYNWSIPADQVPGNTTANGNGGFFPFGASGMLAGAATCFYAFVGFDCIATTGEEVRDPQRAIPVSIVLSLLVCFLAYFGISATLTLMVPYYAIDGDAPLPMAFDSVGWTVAKYIIAVGAVCGLSTSLLGAMFPMPRVIYAMASDGLLFHFLAKVNQRFQTPFIATIISGVFSGVMAMLFDLNALVEMMSIGTLLAYTLVAACVLILRYNNRASEDCCSQVQNEGIIRQLVQPVSSPTYMTALTVKVLVFAMGVVMVILGLMLVLLWERLLQHQWFVLLPVLCLLLLILIINIIIFRQPQDNSFVTFKVPLVPVLPSLSIFINIFLMLKLSMETWVRFGVWMALGFLIYFGYGVWNSSCGEQHVGSFPRYDLPPEEEEETTTENTKLIN